MHRHAQQRPDIQPDKLVTLEFVDGRWEGLVQSNDPGLLCCSYSLICDTREGVLASAHKLELIISSKIQQNHPTFEALSQLKNVATTKE